MSAGLYSRPKIVAQIRHSRRAVIEASAGTGKTFVIEHLVLDLLLCGECSIDQILVVTFTEKATAELRARIRKAIEQMLFGPSDQETAAEAEPVVIDESMRGRLERALREFDRASIFTIHGFCHRVLTDFAFQSGTLLELEVMDSRRAFHGAFRAELRDHLADAAETRELLRKWLVGSQPDQPQGRTPDQLESFLFDLYRRRYLDSCDFSARTKLAEQVIGHYDQKLLKQACSSLSNKKLDAALEALDKLDRIIKGARGSSARLLELLAQFEFKPLDPVLKNVQGQSPRAEELLELIKAAAIAAKSEEWKLADLFLPPVADRLQREKKERGLIDYDDMLAWVARALEDKERGPALTAALRDRFRCALVDEFQDTDDLQWRIFRHVFAADGSANRLYVVGDPKQAIYAFRGADVFTYLSARAELATPDHPPIALVENFRSTANLIDACNHIFDQKAPAPLFENEGKIKYEHPVRCGRADRKAMDCGANPIAPVVLMRYQKSEGKASAAEVRLAIGRHIAEQLRKILMVDDQRITIEDKDQPPRGVEPEHVFVLTRTRAESAEIGGYLAEAGVPFKFYKQEGLFQTPEATHVLDVLRAVAAPHLRSNRLKAWVTPFFGVPLRELALIDEVEPGDPLNERLYQWKSIAERARFADLFDALLHDSGLAARELLLNGSERRLTNYQYIFELLLTAALSHRLGLEEIIALLEDYIYERALPEIDEPNVQRLENERDAVSVITVHMSKGLEADVVAMFGGFGRFNARGELAVYHDEQGRRRFAIGDLAKTDAGQGWRHEQQDEDRRLLYVGLTRARARLYLPLIAENSTKVKPNGYYAALNTRLLAIEEELRGRKSKLFAIQNVAEPSADGDGDELSKRLTEWTPPPALMEEPRGVESEGALWKLRRNHWPLIMRSYTSLRHAEQGQRWNIPDQDFKRDLQSMPEAGDLPGGREVGLYLHEVIERSALDSFAERFEVWRGRADVAGLFRAAMRRHQVKEPWFERGTQIVYDALTTPIALPDGRSVGPLHQCRGVREMEFVYPIPERNQPLLAGAARGEWTVERGYLKGFVDFVFEQDGLIYFADWKSDQLPSYEPAELEQHVRDHYLIQAQIYSIGVLRLLQIRGADEYRRRFGGLLYIFLRGIGSGGRRGVYFHRPAWQEICAYESALMDVVSVDAPQP
jgi:exodeoxyribonuclease V beta subunit